MAVLWLFSNVLSVHAAIPNTIGYQGRLKSASGTALTGTYSFTFRLYAASSGGSALWTETHPSVPTDNGVFSVRLGSVTTFPVSLDFNQALYLTTEVNADGEMSPRVPVNSVSYAFTTGGVDSLAAAPVSSTGGRMFYNTADGSLNYYDGVAATWRALSSTTTGPVATPNLQTVTNAGNTTTHDIQFAGGTSTGAFTFSSSLDVIGATTLGNATMGHVTATSLGLTGIAHFADAVFVHATATHFYTTNLSSGNATVSSLNATNATSSNLYVSGLTSLSSNTTAGGQTICLADGTNCPTYVETDTLLSVTNRGNYATSSVLFYGGLTTSNLTATGTTSLQTA
ncbi:hypothetical protein L0Y59_05395, partial [Candidatus Uhrbacteria bacterium]|nr:hypothetical protein [Candidatus Uhrbacteria bacterium]